MLAQFSAEINRFSRPLRQMKAAEGTRKNNVNCLNYILKKLAFICDKYRKITLYTIYY